MHLSLYMHIRSPIMLWFCTVASLTWVWSRVTDVSYDPLQQLIFSSNRCCDHAVVFTFWCSSASHGLGIRHTYKCSFDRGIKTILPGARGIFDLENTGWKQNTQWVMKLVVIGSYSCYILPTQCLLAALCPKRTRCSQLVFSFQPTIDEPVARS